MQSIPLPLADSIVFAITVAISDVATELRPETSSVCKILEHGVSLRVQREPGRQTQTQTFIHRSRRNTEIGLFYMPVGCNFCTEI